MERHQHCNREATKRKQFSMDSTFWIVLAHGSWWILGSPVIADFERNAEGGCEAIQKYTSASI